MPWKKTDSIVSGNMQRQGLHKAIAAGTVCQEAEKLYPGLFKATAVVNDTLRITVAPEKQIDFRLIEGKLLEEIQAFATPRNLPVPTRIRLTIRADSDIL